MKELKNDIAYVKYRDKYFKNFIKEKWGLFQALDEFTIEDLNEEIKKGNIEIIEVLTLEEIKNRKEAK